MNAFRLNRHLQRSAVVFLIGLTIVGLAAFHGLDTRSLHAQTIPEPGGTLPGGTLPDGTLPPPESLNILYVSSSSGGTVDGVAFADRDILAYDLRSDSWSLFFDASDVDLIQGKVDDLDAFTVLDDGSILMSLSAGVEVEGVGYVKASDVLRFTPDSLGQQTSGSYALFLDSADVGLDSDANPAEDVDAIAITPDGRLALSTNAKFDVPGIIGRDEDLIAFNAESFGAETSGSFERYFDGSDVQLYDRPEDVWGAWIDGSGSIYLSTKGDFRAPGVSGSRADIFVCDPISLGAETACNLRLFWRGGEHGFGSEGIDGLAFASDFPAAFDPTVVTSAADAVEEPNEIDEDIDASDDADDWLTPDEHVADDTAGALGRVYLPLVKQ